MAVSSNLQEQKTSHPFESIDIEIDPLFDPFEAMEGGTKNADGSVTLKQVDPTVTTGNKESEIVEDNKDTEIDALLDATLGKVKENEEGEPEKKVTTNSSEVNANQAYYDLMVEKGLWKATEGFDGSDEALEKAISENHENAIQQDVDAFIEEAFQKNPDGKVYGKALLNHLANGGRISDFVTAYGQDDIVIEDLDNEDKGIAENTAAAMLREYYSDKMKPEKLATFIAGKKKSGLLIDAAKDISEPFDELRTESKKQLETNQKLQKQKQVDNARNYQKSILTVTEQEKIGNISIGKTKQERQELANYMLQPVELENGQKTSKFYAELAEVRSNPEWNVVLAATLRHFKSKKPEGKTEEQKQSSTKKTIQEILEKNKVNLNQSASSESTDIANQSASVKGAWADFV